ncbi:MAG: hypothetical protein F4W95_10490 [Chloroflexi bacterium]|nr:hypothetical protein [Chloroflexota bacterium]MYD48900.1 hypothetical protein [Chloroflexota bacterium]
MRMLTKAEACRELGMSLSTLDRRIAAGDLKAKREPHGRRHRVYVMLDDDPPGNASNDGSDDTALAVAQERIRGLEGQVAILREQLECERQRNADLAGELRAAQDRGYSRWRLWRRGDGHRALTGPAGRGMMDSKTI